METRQRIVIQPECLGGLFSLLRDARLTDELARLLEVVASDL
jgi:hypothetical protein